MYIHDYIIAHVRHVHHVAFTHIHIQDSVHCTYEFIWFHSLTAAAVSAHKIDIIFFYNTSYKQFNR